MQDWPERERYTADDLLQIIRILRDRENGCPCSRQAHSRSCLLYTSGGIIAAVLQLFQTIQQNILCIPFSNITNNATHTKHLHACLLYTSGQTVNLLLFSFGGSNPPAPIKRPSA